MADPHSVFTAAKIVRHRAEDLETNKTFDNALRLQRAKLNHRIVVNETIKLVKEQNE